MPGQPSGGDGAAAGPVLEVGDARQTLSQHRKTTMSPAIPARIEKLVKNIDYKGHLHMPHNGLIEHMGRNLECSRALVELLLPKKDVERLDPNNPPYLTSGRSIAVDGTIREADLVFYCPALDGDDFDVVVEHKSWPDMDTPLQAMRIKERLWSKEFDGGDGKMGSLREIRYVVFYHGDDDWKVPFTTGEMTGRRTGQKRRSLGERIYSLFRLRMGHVYRVACLSLRSCLMAFVLCKSERVTERELRVMAEGIECNELGCYLSLYIVQVLRVPAKVLTEALVNWSPDGKGMERFMSTVFEEGRQEGLQEGEQKGIRKGVQQGIRKGKVETFLRLAQDKFRDVPKSLEKRLLAAPLAQLDGWLSRLLNADSLDAVFKAPAKG